MNPARKTLTTATALLLAGLGASACDSDGAAPRSTASTAAATEATATTGGRTMEGLTGALEPGPWAVPIFASGYRSLPRAVVDVPEGYGTPGGWVVDRGADGDPENYGSVSFWTVESVVTRPCADSGHEHVGPSVADLARALRDEHGHRATAPTATTLDGHPGVRLDVAVPARLAGCSDGAYTLWRADDGESYRTGVPGTLARLWILDVDGTRVVAVADSTPHETPAEAAQVVRIARSARFVSPSEVRGP